MSVKLLAFFSPKGGVGKTTLSTQTAVSAVMNKKTVVFYDLDQQKTSSMYFSTIDEKYRPAEILHNLSTPPSVKNIDYVIADFPPNLSVLPPKDFLLISPTTSSSLDLHAYRVVLELEEDFKIIKVINQFSKARKDDKALLENERFKNCVVISTNQAIRHAMNIKKSVWNSNITGGSKAKRQFQYLFDMIEKGEADYMDLEKLDEISKSYKIKKIN